MPTTAANPNPRILVAAAALIDADGRVLLAKRPTGKNLAGLWEFPGGKIETSETPIDTLIRELNEELGVNTEASCFAPLSFSTYSYEDFDLILLLYICRRWQGTPAPKENNPITWVKPNRLGDYEMPKADAPLIAALQDLL